MSEPISPTVFLEAEGTEDWRVVGDGACACFRTGSFAAGVQLVQAIGRLPGIDSDPPDIDLRPETVTVRMVASSETHFGMTREHIESARGISAAARELGFAADPSGVQSVLVIPGAPDIAGVMPFWEAVLGYRRRPDSPQEDLVDGQNRGPAFWFEQMQEPRAGGGGAIHIAVWMPYEEAQARVDAALAAGGRIVRDDFAPAWWTLADPAGNEADIATPKHRG